MNTRSSRLLVLALAALLLSSGWLATGCVNVPPPARSAPPLRGYMVAARHAEVLAMCTGLLCAMFLQRGGILTPELQGCVGIMDDGIARRGHFELGPEGLLTRQPAAAAAGQRLARAMLLGYAMGRMMCILGACTREGLDREMLHQQILALLRDFHALGLLGPNDSLATNARSLDARTLPLPTRFRLGNRCRPRCLDGCR